ncbi:hypothetical protein M436DRAFT_85762 [Aureobasidium namibiae CBS 147.97]|uniref:BTB domain-containing protein n=1 Tax=Aureobasidium namibiae CBS 147.97 TaxID=1043004 RepID=A0A074X3E7_9PEZI
MVAEKALQMLLKGLANLEDRGDHSDLMIICGSDAYEVHKAIVCSQSEFFKLACRKHTDDGGDFKEAQSGIVEIPSYKTDANTTEPEDFKWDADEDDPKCVKLMIHYFYHLDYLEVETAKVKEKKRTEENYDEAHVLKEGLLIDHAKIAGFANSMMVIYTSTIDNDMDLRNVIIKILKNDITNLMKKPKIDQTVKDLPLLSHALLRKSLNLP